MSSSRASWLARRRNVLDEDHLKAEIARLQPWYQTIEVAPGITTPGKGSVGEKLALISQALPDDLSGVRILDAGCNAGGLALSLARRGADVVGVESNRHYFEQAKFLREVIGPRHVRFVRGTVYDVRRLRTEFDIVLLLGLVYHLRHPQLALDRIASVCRDRIVLSTPCLRTDAAVSECRLRDVPDEGIGDEDEPAHNWWFPSLTVLRAMLAAAGFHECHVLDSSERSFVSSDDGADNESAFATGSLVVVGDRRRPVT